MWQIPNIALHFPAIAALGSHLEAGEHNGDKIFCKKRAASAGIRFLFRRIDSRDQLKQTAKATAREME